MATSDPRSAPFFGPGSMLQLIRSADGTLGSRFKRIGRRWDVEVKDASLENGLLHVDLVRELPEAMKARAIPIASSRKLLEVEPTLAA